MSMTEVRRDEDSELMGYVGRDDAGADGAVWAALTVFGGVIGRYPTEDEAHRTVRTCGLSSMAEPWQVRVDGRWWPCRLQEVWPARVRLWITDRDYPNSPCAVVLENPSHDVLRRL